MKEIIVSMVEDAFHEDTITKEAINYLSKYIVRKGGDIRIARKTLMKSAKLATNKGDKKIDTAHVASYVDKAQYAKSVSMIEDLSSHEKFILRLIPKKGTNYPNLFKFYKKIDGPLEDRMVRNYLQNLQRLKLINMEKRMGNNYFITLIAPKDVLFEN